MSDTVRSVSLAAGSLIAATVAFLVGQELQNKPFKISHVADFYDSFSYYGPAIALAVSLAAAWAVRERLPRILATLLPTLLFPFVLWTVYQTAFFLAGHEAGFDRGDLSPLTAELAFAHILIKWGTLGFCVGLVPAAVSFATARGRSAH